MDTHCPKRLEYWSDFPLDESGRPTTHTAYRLLRAMFGNSSRWYRLAELSDIVVADPNQIDVMLRQLEAVDIAIRHKEQPDCWRYNLRCRNVEFQALVEGFFADADLGGLPEYLTRGDVAQPPRRSLAAIQEGGSGQ